jgi:HEAT repeat protein
MTKPFISVTAWLTFASVALGALTKEQLSALKQNLANSDPVVRREALNELENERPETAGNGVVPVLSAALADQDAPVRAGAAAVLAMISFSTSPKFTQLNERVTDIRSYPRVQAALVAAFNDPDEETRKNALAAYIFAFDVPPAMQDQLASRFDSERPISLFRTTILYALSIDGTPTETAKALLLRVANDPNEAVKVAEVIKDCRRPPIELLPTMVSQFTSATDKPRRQAFARALSKFGGAARLYLPTLREAASRESDESTKRTINEAVGAISAAK